MLQVDDLKRLTIGPVNLRVNDGACLAVTGPSGAGKSVLLRAIADLDPNMGAARTQSAERALVPAPLWRRHVALVPAESGWWGDSVHSHFRAPEEARARLSEVALPEAAMDWDVARLSTGERHRLALLRALENGPEVLLLDEPTSMLDRASEAAVEALLKREMDNGLSLVLVTHDADQPARLADRLIWLEGGSLREIPRAEFAPAEGLPA